MFLSVAIELVYNDTEEQAVYGEVRIVAESFCAMSYNRESRYFYRDATLKTAKLEKRNTCGVFADAGLHH